MEPHVASARAARLSGYTHVEEGTFPEAARVFPTQAFDAIFFNDVLEHMVDPAAALPATRRLLSPTGYVIASIPNVRHLSVWWPLIRYGDWPYADLVCSTNTLEILYQKDDSFVVSTDGMDNRINNRNKSYALARLNIDTWKTRWLGRLTLGRTDESSSHNTLSLHDSIQSGSKFHIETSRRDLLNQLSGSLYRGSWKT